jgi:hypothetical protein
VVALSRQIFCVFDFGGGLELRFLIRPRLADFASHFPKVSIERASGAGVVREQDDVTPHSGAAETRFCALVPGVCALPQAQGAL